MRPTAGVSMRLASAALALEVCCAPPMQRTATRSPAPDRLAELWVDPGETRRNLAEGPGPHAAIPAADARYEIVSRDTRGFSTTYVVKDEGGRSLHVKIGPEAQTEVVSSRLVWALGYHQVPSWFVERWIGVDHGRGQQFGGARFRPDEIGLKKVGVWDWHRNPFVGERPFNGLLVLMMIMNSTDLKTENNELYDVKGGPREGAGRWYVVKDLGASLGETGRFEPKRGDIDAFEREPFITGVDRGRVRFGYHGRHQELLAGITPDDVHWACRRLAKLTDGEWRAAFRAGHFTPEEIDRYVRRFRERIEQGEALR